MKMKKNRITIYDLAQLAGTSASAVSSILNNKWQTRRISPALAEKVSLLAKQHGYAVNRQASILRKAHSHMIGMIVPKYDNRYFTAIAEQFEIMARQRSLFPVITCTFRNPQLELEAARELLSYQVECVVATGCTNPDAIAQLCHSANVQIINLDLPGKTAPSVISDNFNGAKQLTKRLLDIMKQEFNHSKSLWFIGGRKNDHNTQQRIQGFIAAHNEHQIEVNNQYILTPGYSSNKIEQLMKQHIPPEKTGLFINSTIALEGFLRMTYRLSPNHAASLRYGSFDWDPFAALLPQNIGMIRQDIQTMLETVFQWIETPPKKPIYKEIPCLWNNGIYY